MKNNKELNKSIQKLLKDQQGVLIKDDLWAILAPSSDVDFYRKIKKLISEEVISKICRGFYVGEGFSTEALIMSMRPESYLSLEYALAKYNMIGSYSQNKIRPVLPMIVRKITSPKIIIEFKKISDDLMFGIEVLDGFRIANAEKAFLDTLYFYQKGTKYYFDIYSDIDLSNLDLKRVRKYLKSYKNSKFVKFVEDYLDD